MTWILRLFLVAAAAIGAVAGLMAWTGDGSDVRYAGDLRIGGRIERLSLPPLDDGGAIEYSTLSGRPLVINFFASWCPSCVAEMPAFERVHRSLGADVAFLGVSQSDSIDASVELVRRTGVTYPAGVDGRGAFFNALGVTGTPTTVFVRPGGEIAEIWQGPLDEATLLQMIEDHLGVVD